MPTRRRRAGVVTACKTGEPRMCRLAGDAVI